MATRRNRADAQPTWTSRVTEFLTKADDFATVGQIMAGTGANLNQTTAALHHLKNRHAVDCVASEGQLWWFATPGTDDRARVVEQRVPEEPGTRRRGSKVNQPK